MLFFVIEMGSELREFELTTSIIIFSGKEEIT